MDKNGLTRIKKQDHLNHVFYQVPKFFFTNDFIRMSSTSKILYSLLKDRHDLSVTNGWVNDHGEIYHIMTQENMSIMLGVSIRTARDAFKKLVDARFIENVRTGITLPNKLYLNILERTDTEMQKSNIGSDRRRVTVTDLNNNQFIQIPKFLFSYKYEKLSNDARLLYGLLKDRNELSIINNFVNENDEIYFTFSRDEMCEMMGVSKPTIIKAINQLKDFHLLEEERRGMSRKNRIYLSHLDKELYEIPNLSIRKAVKSIITNKNTLEKVKKIHSRLHICRSKDIACPEVKNLPVKKSTICRSRSKESAGQEVKNLPTNKTYLNKTDFNKTYIYLSIIKRLNNLTNGHYEKGIELSIKEDRLIDLKYMIQELVESMLGYHDIKMKYEVTYFNDKAPILKSFRDVIVEYLLIPEELTKINNKMIPYELVADRLLAINHDTIILCVDKIFNLDRGVKNMNSYLLSTLYNSIVEDGATHHAIFNEKYYAN